MQEPYLDRERALSYGRMAVGYDRYRPTYPDALMELRPQAAVDIGCGTGRVAAALAGRGLSVLGVEPDAQMAAVARGHGLPVEVSTFETWDDGGRRFDLVTSGASWHWIDPALGVTKAARVLRPGGTLARFWNYEVPEERAAAVLDEVYLRLAPGATRFVASPDVDWADPVAASDAFSTPEKRTYEWARSLGADEWVGMATTFSDHQRLGADRLAALQESLAAAIEGLGGVIHARCGTFAILARRL